MQFTGPYALLGRPPSQVYPGKNKTCSRDVITWCGRILHSVFMYKPLGRSPPSSGDQGPWYIQKQAVPQLPLRTIRATMATKQSASNKCVAQQAWLLFSHLAKPVAMHCCGPPASIAVTALQPNVTAICVLPHEGEGGRLITLQHGGGGRLTTLHHASTYDRT